MLAANDKIRCVRCSMLPSSYKQSFFITSKGSARNESVLKNQYSLYFLNHEKSYGTGWTIIEIPVMSRGYSGKFFPRQCNIQISGDNLGEQKVLESSFFRLLQSLKFEIFPPLGTMVLPPRNTGLVIILSISATRG